MRFKLDILSGNIAVFVHTCTLQTKIFISFRHLKKRVLLQQVLGTVPQFLALSPSPLHESTGSYCYYPGVGITFSSFQSFLCDGQVLSGELSCMQTGLI